MAYDPILLNVELFKGLNKQQIESILTICNTFEKTFKKNEVIYCYSEPIPYAGIILDGSINITLFNQANNEHRIAKVSKGSLFAEAYAVLNLDHTAIEVTASSDCKILFLDLLQIYQHLNDVNISKVLANLLQETAKRNVIQMEKIEILSQKSIREKLIVFFAYRYLKYKSRTFTIPFTRQELANFLCTDRSALSRELSKLQKEGHIAFKQKSFTLLDDEMFHITI